MGRFRVARSQHGKVVIREDNFGADQSMIIYPGLSSCISITADSNQGIVGVHITVATEDSIIEDMMTNMNMAVGSAYVVGQIQEFKEKRKAQGRSLDTRKKVSKLLKHKLAGVNNVYFYDIGPLSKDADVLVTKNVLSPAFSWANVKKIGWEFIPDADTSHFAPINLAAFHAR